MTIPKEVQTHVRDQLISLYSGKSVQRASFALQQNEIAIYEADVEMQEVKSGFRASSSDRIGFGRGSFFGGGFGQLNNRHWSNYGHRWGRSGPAPDQFVSTGLGSLTITSERILFFGDRRSEKLTIAQIERLAWFQGRFFSPSGISIHLTHKEAPIRFTTRNLSVVYEIVLTIDFAMNNRYPMAKAPVAPQTGPQLTQSARKTYPI